jgi:hypothetical protein
VRDGFAAFDGEGRSVEREGRIAVGVFHAGTFPCKVRPA